MSMRNSYVRFNLALSALLIFGLSACDSGMNGSESDSTLSIAGTVTDDAGFAKNQAAIEGAVVTASEVQSGGSLRTLSGEASTDASGRYSLDLESSAGTMILRAAKADFESKVIVESTGSGSVSAMPMNGETRAEADVYVETRANAATSGVAAADVALFVDSEVANAISAGSATAAEVAVAITSGKSAERSHADEDPEGFDDDESRRQVDEDRRQSFLTLQSQLNAAPTTSAQVAARRAFERAFVEAFADAGIDASLQARASHSRKAAIVEATASSNISAEAEFALRKRANATVALATTAAIEALLEANGAAQTRIDAIATAGEALYSSIASAESAVAISAAYGDFSAAVEAELSAEIGVSAAVLGTARAATDAAKVTLQTSIETAVGATEIASAYVTFFAAAEASATASLSASSNASLGGQILALIALF